MAAVLAMVSVFLNVAHAKLQRLPEALLITARIKGATYYTNSYLLYRYY